MVLCVFFFTGFLRTCVLVWSDDRSGVLQPRSAFSRVSVYQFVVVFEIEVSFRFCLCW